MGRNRIVDDESLREEFTQLRTDIEGLVGTVGRLADDAAGSLREGAKRTVSAVGRRASDAFDGADRTVQAHPYISLALVAGLGWLIGRYVSPRK